MSHVKKTGLNSRLVQKSINPPKHPKIGAETTKSQIKSPSKFSGIQISQRLVVKLGRGERERERCPPSSLPFSAANAPLCRFILYFCTWLPFVYPYTYFGLEFVGKYY